MEQVASEFLRALRGKRSQVAFARRLGYRGNPITDWERGVRFPTAVEALRAAARAQTRQAAFVRLPELPWTEAVLRLLETRAYRELEQPAHGWLARILGIPPHEERRCLQALADVGAGAGGRRDQPAADGVRSWLTRLRRKSVHSPGSVVAGALAVA